jgi:hypothetical protein
VRVIPKIARRATAQIARQAARGQQVTPQMAVRALATQAQRTLASPGTCVHAYKRARALDRAHHRMIPAVVPVARVQAPPSCKSCRPVANGHAVVAVCPTCGR